MWAEWNWARKPRFEWVLETAAQHFPLFNLEEVMWLTLMSQEKKYSKRKMQNIN